jgi:hypothetical protein
MLIVILLLVLGYAVIHRYRKKTGRKGMGRVVQNMLILAAVAVVVAIVGAGIFIVVGLHYDPLDMEFNAYQLALTRGLNKGDTLVFASKAGIEDTLMVTGMEEERKTQPGIFMALPASHSRYISFRRSCDPNGTYELGTNSLPQSKKRHVMIDFGRFRYADEGAGQLDTVTIGDTVLSGCYLRRNADTYGAEAAGSITAAIWAPQQGLIAFETAGKDGAWFWRKH